jgi:hypothetical protein
MAILAIVTTADKRETVPWSARIMLRIWLCKTEMAILFETAQ